MAHIGPMLLAKTNGHHLQEATFNLSGKIGVPLHATNQHNAIGFKGILVEKCFNSIIRFTQADDIQL